MKKEGFVLFLFAKSLYLKHKIILYRERIKQKEEDIKHHQEVLSLIEKVQTEVGLLFSKPELESLQETAYSQEEQEKEKEPPCES